MKQIAKALLILILSVWASAENNLLSASNSPRSSAIKRVEVFQHRPHHERPQFKNPIMNDKDFQYLYKVIKKKAFEKDQLELLSVGVLDNYFSCKQCVKIMSLCSFDSEKLKVLDIMAKHIVDLEHADLILESFTFDSNREKAAKTLLDIN